MNVRALVISLIGPIATGFSAMGIAGGVIGYVLIAWHDRRECQRARREAFEWGRSVGMPDATIEQYCQDRLPRGGL